MLSTIFKKKLTNNQLANIFVNGVLDTIDKGFDELRQMIKEDPAFIVQPPVDGIKDGHFTMIVIVANITNLINFFDAEQSSNLEDQIKEKFAQSFGMDLSEFEKYFKDYKSYICRVNHPSKNMVYGMSKALFFKYKLNEYQDDYFKNLVTPNPLFLKRMDEVMDQFIWDWDVFQKKFKLGNN
jgi:hypothetical protein